LKNYYAILEVPIGGGLEEIRRAYRRLSQENIDNEAVFADLREAYEVLTTPARRAEYDLSAWGETFVAGGPGAATHEAAPGPSGRCPVGPEGQCPVVQGRVTSGDKFCPECGFLLAGLAAAAPVRPGGTPDAARRRRLEEPGGRSHPLRPGLNMVGREGTDVLLPDKTVSRQHARLEVEVGDDQSVTVEDLSSTNGTQLNGELLVPHVLRHLADGDRVRFGSVLTHLVLPGAGTPAADSPVVGVTAVLAASSGAMAYPAPDGATSAQGPAAFRDAGGASHPGSPAALAQVVEMRDEGGRAYPLVPGVTTFGRRADSSVVIQNDPYVSGSHAQIIADGGEFRLTDLDSTNGTLLNGERLAANAPAMLTAGDVLLIGGTPLRFERLGAEADPEAALEGHAAEESEEEPEPEAAGAAVFAGPSAAPAAEASAPTSTEG